MSSEQIAFYQKTIDSLKQASLLLRAEKNIPENYIVATHGTSLIRALGENPELLNLIGIYRVNCSHLGKEGSLKMLAEYLKILHPFVPILIDLQGPKPRIHETLESGGIPVKIGDRFEVSYEKSDSDNRFCKTGKLTVCFPEIIEVMQVGDTVIFDDGKMTAIVREKAETVNIIECTEITGDNYSLGSRKGICVRNRPLGIQCITDQDRKSIDFVRDILGFGYADNIMVSYFSSLVDIEYFVRIMREEYGYTGKLGGKFETPHSVCAAGEILAIRHLTLAMLGRGDLRVEMDPRGAKNIHDIQTHFFAVCRDYSVESICATGFLESMLTPEGQVTEEEVYDMKTSIKTGANHLMLSGETTYGSQAGKCIELESSYQRDMYAKLKAGMEKYSSIPEVSLVKLLYLE